MSLAVILDMDGLLLDTEPISLRAWKAAAVDLGYDLDEDVCQRMIGISQANNRRMLVGHFGSDLPIDELVNFAQARYRELLDAEGVPHKAGLVEFLRFLDRRRIPRAVATSTETVLAAHKLERAGVLQHFDIIVGGEQVARGKPDPDIFLEAAARLGYPSAECVVLEDSGPGVQAAAAAGMRAILIPDLSEPSAETRKTAHAVVASLTAAAELIERWINDGKTTSDLRNP